MKSQCMYMYMYMNTFWEKNCDLQKLEVIVVGVGVGADCHCTAADAEAIASAQRAGAISTWNEAKANMVGVLPVRETRDVGLRRTRADRQAAVDAVRRWHENKSNVCFPPLVCRRHVTVRQLSTRTRTVYYGTTIYFFTLVSPRENLQKFHKTGNYHFTKSKLGL